MYGRYVSVVREGVFPESGAACGWVGGSDGLSDLGMLFFQKKLGEDLQEIGWRGVLPEPSVMVLIGHGGDVCGE